MVRFAQKRRVFFVEEPVFDAANAPHMTLARTDGVHVVTPHLADGGTSKDANTSARRLLRDLFETQGIDRPLLWFYTPMALPLVDGLPHAGIAYDCMDELSGFAQAPTEMRAAERALLARADVVFTGGLSLYEVKRSLHPNVHPFPSSVDVAHFSTARTCAAQPPDQAQLPGPRIGFCGVIDERMNLDLLRDVARTRPNWQFVMIGPLAKISGADLPQRPNIHYLGMKGYPELPSYFSGWDVAIMPFAHNAATRFISPTKTPEYLAAGIPVVSTSIRDVVRPYGERGFVKIADTADEFCRAIEHCLTPAGPAAVQQAQTLLQTMSWDRTYEQMSALVEQAVDKRTSRTVRSRLRTEPVAAALTAPIS
jgi:UDP-galactopyranose mutase